MRESPGERRQEVMGPNLLIDKSALQSLSQQELYKLTHHYNLTTCSVLLIEILGDLKKNQSADGFSTAEVQQLARKLVHTYPCANQRDLLVGNLLGHPVPMTGQVPRGGGKRVTHEGETGVVFGVSPENEAILRWKNGEFSEAEKALADLWREATRLVDLERFQREHKGKIRRFKSLDNLHRFVSFISHPKEAAERRNLLAAVLQEFDIPRGAQGLIFEQWKRAGYPDIEEFAPYAYHCFKVSLVFKYGVVTGLITTRRTNQVDLQYLYHAPFCQVFCSRDNLHRDLAAVFPRDDQSFVHGDELKADLKRLIAWYEGLTPEERREREYDYGSRPPFDENSVTHRVWRKHMRPWTPGSGNRAIKMSKEEQQAIIKKINAIMEAAEKHSST
jgi:hypothetical protein